MTYETPIGANMFAYCGNNPVMNEDYSGHAWETFLDVGFAIWSSIEFLLDPSVETAASAAMDIGAAAIPFVPSTKLIEGAGVAFALFAKSDNLHDFGKVASKTTDRVFNIKKQDSAIFRSFNPVKNRSYRTSGHGKKAKYYQWDHTHNDIEVYNSNKKHIGSMNPITGEMYKPPVPGRILEE